MNKSLRDVTVTTIQVVVRRVEISTYHTQWAGAFAIAAELSRRGYTAAFTLGNAPPPAFDLICVAPSGRPFKVEAKSTAAPTFIRTGRKIFELPLQNNLFLIVALLPYNRDPGFSFFIFTHDELRHIWQETSRKKRSGEAYVEGHEGLTWRAVEAQKDRWDKLPR